MQPDASNAKQQIVEKVRQATNILVAVSTNPSVDALAGALALSLMLNKMDKHATAVFSGSMPPAMEFLDAGKKFDNTVDSLRDFIISLDKEKADRLRYKVENDVVRIFITPYKTTITEKDLQFSQGDFNVELILALGVDKRDDLDKAIVAHGRILHDATVVTINVSNQKSTLGTIDWHDANASSLSEMLMSLAESFQQPGLLDSQIATALLTGIVAATDRFSNERTNPKVMTMSAQLMAAGANQQLIATNLTKAMAISGPAAAAEEPAKAGKAKDGEIDITHREKGDGDNTTEKQERELAAALPTANAPTTDQLKADLEAETKAEETKAKPFLQEKPGPQTGDAMVSMEGAHDEPSEESPYVAGHGSWRGKKIEAPALGGSLSATAEQALEDERKADEESRNQTMLKHSEPVPTSAPDPAGATSPVTAVEPAEEAQPAEPLAMPPLPVVEPPALNTLAPEPPQPEPITPPKPSPTADGATQPPAMPATPAAEPPVLEPLPAPSMVQQTPASEPNAPPQMAVPTVAPEPPVTPEPPQPTDQPAAETAPLNPEIDAARQAVSDAFASQPFDPANSPLQAAGASQLSGPLNQPAGQNQPLEPVTTPLTLSAEPTSNLEPLPPLPPMPPLLQGDPLAPPPSLPEQPAENEQQLLPPPVPQLPPEPQPDNPGQFKIPGA